MDLKYLFNNWAKHTEQRYQQKQWLLSKWDVFDGIHWPYDKVELLTGHIRSIMDLRPSYHFLDLGCGGGWLLDYFSSSVGLSVGCDVAIEMLKNGSGKCSLINGDACFLPFQDEAFDRILCYFVFINFSDLCLVEEALVQMVRVMKPGGKALIGQLPDFERSDMYDREKKRYLDFCKEHYNIGENTRDTFHIPVQLFNRSFFEQLLIRLGCRVKIINSFNPFYRHGEPERIPWRFDILIEKAVKHEKD